MLKKLGFYSLFLLIGGCLEPYEFIVHDNEPSLVVEAYISDKSFDETLLYPSDGRYFTVKLSETGDVTNTRAIPVTGAVVELWSNDNEVWPYTEGVTGIYSLLDAEFKAQRGIQYKLRILLTDETVYESEWVSLPQVDAPPIGEVGFTETERQTYIMESSEWVLKSIKGVSANIQIPKNISGGTIHYRWTYAPMWIYVAPLISRNSPVYKCWATDAFHLKSYGLQIDKSGRYVKDLFFFPTIRNERIFEKFSVLITQQVMNEPYYSFWKEMKDRNEGSALVDIPPYNLKTNFSSSSSSSSPSGEKNVSGFFGVVTEQAKQWYFKKEELSYGVENTLKADCLVNYGPGSPAEECTDCRAYSFGIATTRKPAWWQD